MIDPETTKRLLLTRIKEWDSTVSGEMFFDSKEINRMGGTAADLIRQMPEATLEHG